MTAHTSHTPDTGGGKAEEGRLGPTALLFVPIVAGLAASAVLIVDYTRTTPLFCDPDSGCGALKQTIFASFLNVPTPIWGLLGFVLAGWFGLQRGKAARTTLLVLASIAALVAVGLLGVQALLGVWCKFCLVTDTSALALFGFALWRKLGAWDPPSSVLARVSVGGWMVPAMAIPIAFGVLKKPVVPDVILREMAQTPKGEVTLVDFADFECPYCRKAHAMIEPVLAQHHDDVRVVRKNVPLPMHPHAFDAARAACCGEQMGKGEDMANALFAAPVDDLTPEGCAKLATSLGLDEAAFKKCTSDPKTDARINEDRAAFKAAHGHGLPTLWIDDQKLEGFRGDGSTENALEAAIGKKKGQV